MTKGPLICWLVSASLFLAVAVIGVTGCGSDDNGATTPPRKRPSGVQCVKSPGALKTCVVEDGFDDPAHYAVCGDAGVSAAVMISDAEAGNRTLVYCR